MRAAFLSSVTIGFVCLIIFIELQILMTFPYAVLPSLLLTYSVLDSIIFLSSVFIY
jgi:hypothetical protein